MTKIYNIADGRDLREYVEAPDRCFGYGDYVIVKHPEYKDYIVKYHEGMVAPGGCIINLLVPLESEEVTVDTSQASEQVIEMFAALSRKIVSLERQLADTQRNLERQAEELENAKHRIDKQGGWLIKNTVRLDKAEELVEMLTDDVITLDERTQVINAITKFYGGERR